MRRFPRRNDENDKTRLVRDFPPLEKRTFKTDYFLLEANSTKEDSKISGKCVK